MPPLPTVETNRALIRADKLQQLHTMHNLAQLLGISAAGAAGAAQAAPAGEGSAGAAAAASAAAAGAGGGGADARGTPAGPAARGIAFTLREADLAQQAQLLRWGGAPPPWGIQWRIHSDPQAAFPFPPSSGGYPQCPPAALLPAAPSPPQ